MLSFILCQLVISAIYSWINLNVLGYHGAVGLMLISLWGAGYLSSWDFLNLWINNNYYFLVLFNWIEIGNHILVDFLLLGDGLTLILLVIMTIGSFIVINFVYIELWDDKEGANFIILLVIFLSFMGILVAGGNLIIFYLGWEGIGLTSLFLINFWSERSRGFKASYKVYVINKIGDFLLLIGLCLLLNTLGNLNFYYCENMCWLLLHYTYGGTFINFNLCDLAALTLFCGGAVKSSQFGFHIWLLEAMEAPLGASALMHSSTLVVAGIILTLRLNILLEFSSVTSCWLIIWGAWTSLFAAITACFQYELKIIMAYSTISSLGFMYCLLGLHAYLEVLLYLIIHAFIKIFLFLIVGAIMFHCGGCQDVRWMGGLLHYIPILNLFYIIGAAGLGGLPYLSGYYCKSQGLQTIFYLNEYFYTLYIYFIINSICTYLYLVRLGLLIFGGLKLGHRAIYRPRWFAFNLNILFTISCFLIIFGGSLWLNFLVDNNVFWQLGWQIYYNYWYIYVVPATYTFWVTMLFIYLLVINLIIIIIYNWGAHDRSWFKKIYFLVYLNMTIILLFILI